MDDHFEFSAQAEIIPKRYRLIVPRWKEILDDLGIEEIATDDISDINQLAIQEQIEEADCKLLHELLQYVREIDDDDAKKEYILQHQPLRAVLRKAMANQ
jgi:hypothetical protein